VAGPPNSDGSGPTAPGSVAGCRAALADDGLTDDGLNDDGVDDDGSGDGSAGGGSISDCHDRGWPGSGSGPDRPAAPRRVC
jgi:hypothetical protein